MQAANRNKESINTQQDAPYDNSSVSLPTIQRKMQVIQSQDMKLERNATPDKTEEVFILNKGDSFGNVFKVNQMNALANKRNKHRLERIAVDSRDVPSSSFVYHRKSNARASIS
jgi:hypothetical protein